MLAVPVRAGPADPASSTEPLIQTKIQYLSGGGQSEPIRSWKAAPSWKDRLTISRDAVEITIHKGGTIRIDPARVTALTYAGMKRTRDELWFLAGGEAPYMVPPSVTHLIQIDYTLADGTAAAVLLRAHKSNYDALLRALRTVTGIPDNAPPHRPKEGTAR
jgi:hypothetical protein